MSLFKSNVAVFCIAALVTALSSGPVFAGCDQDAYKLLERENKKCYASFGRNGEKNRNGWKKCKHAAKEKYRAARAKCK